MRNIRRDLILGAAVAAMFYVPDAGGVIAGGPGSTATLPPAGGAVGQTTTPGTETPAAERMRDATKLYATQAEIDAATVPAGYRRYVVKAPKVGDVEGAQSFVVARAADRAIATAAEAAGWSAIIPGKGEPSRKVEKAIDVLKGLTPEERDEILKKYGLVSPAGVNAVLQGDAIPPKPDPDAAAFAGTTTTAPGAAQAGGATSSGTPDAQAKANADAAARAAGGQQGAAAAVQAPKPGQTGSGKPTTGPGSGGTGTGAGKPPAKPQTAGGRR